MKDQQFTVERDSLRSAFVIGLLLVAVLLNVISLMTASWVTSYHVYEGVGNYQLAEHRAGAFNLCLTFSNYDDHSQQETCYSFSSESTLKNVITGQESQATMCDYGRDAAAFEALGLLESQRILALVESMCGGSGSAVFGLQITSIVVTVATLGVFITGIFKGTTFDQYKIYEMASIVSVAVTSIVYFALVAMWTAGVDHAGGAGISATLIAFALLMLLLVAVNLRACIIPEPSPQPDNMATLA